MMEGLTVWVDADSCPRPVRDIICRAAERTGVSAVFVANRDVPILDTIGVDMRIVTGDKTADEVICAGCAPGDLVITRDIPLAARLLEKGCIVLNDRGDRFTEGTIRERLSIRDAMKDFRESGLLDQGKRTYGRREVHAFAAAFDRELMALLPPGGKKG